MSSENIVVLTDANFEEEVLKSSIPVLVDFWGEGCAPCMMIAPILDQLADEYAGRFKVGKFDIESDRDAPGKLGVKSIPTLMMFKGGTLTKTILGAKSKMVIKAEMDDVLGE